MNDETKKPRYPRRGKAPIISLDQPGRLRIENLMALYSVCHQTLYERLKTGAIPKADGYDGRRPYWNTATIKSALLGGG